MIEIQVPFRADAELIATALLVAAGHLPSRMLVAGERNRCVQLAQEVRDGLAEVKP